MWGKLARIPIIAPSVERFLCKSPIMLQIGTSVPPNKILQVGRRIVKLFKKILGATFYSRSLYIYIYIYIYIQSAVKRSSTLELFWIISRSVIYMHEIFWRYRGANLQRYCRGLEKSCKRWQNYRDFCESTPHFRQIPNCKNSIQ